MNRSANRLAGFFGLLYAVAVVVVLLMSLSPGADGPQGLLAVILALPWGLGVVLLLDTLDPALVRVLGPPIIALCGLANAFLLRNSLRSRGAN